MTEIEKCSAYVRDVKDGGHRTFIKKDIAERLHLTVIRKTKILMNAFSTSMVIEVTAFTVILPSRPGTSSATLGEHVLAGDAAATILDFLRLIVASTTPLLC